MTDPSDRRPSPPEHPSRRHEWEMGVGLQAGEEDFEDEDNGELEGDHDDERN